MQARAQEHRMTHTAQGDGASTPGSAPQTGSDSPPARRWVVHRQLPHYRDARCPTCVEHIGSG
eukprot:9732860-Prorocentrum_lima.AAC.1